ncbi:MAG: hypothetical protein KAJ19_20580 [Gammaproteobacteria bacterium]|nr:hypothetical protein [Gammaproteobacteria bacterium]
MDAGKATKLRQIIERAKRDLISRYDLTHAAMRGEFMSAIYSPSVPSAKAQGDLDRRLDIIGSEAARTERNMATSVTEEINEVVDWIKTPEAVANLFAFKHDIVSQIGRDARAISSLFRQVQTSLNALTRDKHLSAKAQALKHIIKPSVFAYRDKIGKIWDSKVYLRTRSSKYYYELANDLAVGNIQSEGRTSATLDRPGHPSDGLKIDLVDINPEMESKYFHPGSQGILV